MWFNPYFGGIEWLGKTTSKKLEQFKNNIEYQNTLISLYNLALEMFEWEGLPETCNQRFLEMSLLTRGQAILANHKGAYINLGSSSTGHWNLYGEPVKAHGYGLNGFHEQFDLYIDGADDAAVVRNANGFRNSKGYSAVLCRDNTMAYPYINYMVNAAERLMQAIRSTDVAMKNLKMPVMVTCEESLVPTVKELFNNIDSNVACVISSGKLPFDSIQVFDLKANPEILKVMWEHYERINNMIHEILGVDTPNQADKKERLLVDEVNGNEAEVNYNLGKRYMERKLFCERVNKAFPELSIDVKLRMSASDLSEQVAKILGTGGNENVDEPEVRQPARA